jgi:hypothetical protein
VVSNAVLHKWLVLRCPVIINVERSLDGRFKAGRAGAAIEEGLELRDAAVEEDFDGRCRGESGGGLFVGAGPSSRWLRDLCVGLLGTCLGGSQQSRLIGVSAPRLGGDADDIWLSSSDTTSGRWYIAALSVSNMIPSQNIRLNVLRCSSLATTGSSCGLSDDGVGVSKIPANVDATDPPGSLLKALPRRCIRANLCRNV